MNLGPNDFGKIYQLEGIKKEFQKQQSSKFQAKNVAEEITVSLSHLAIFL
jgi:hypothetical protein